MAFQLSAFSRFLKFFFGICFFLFIFLQSGCLEPTTPEPIRPDADKSSPPTSSSENNSGDPSSLYTNAGAVKVIFNKSSFYTNMFPNSQGCAGDAKTYYDPMGDNAVPLQPNWLKNVSVDLTNSNAFSGPSRATSCGLSGLGSPPAANCASFDDLQPLDGSQSRTVLIGGYGCSSGGAGCSATSAVGDIWNLNVPDLATGSIWSQQSSLPTTTVYTQPGRVWHSGDYDELHNKFFIFGGVALNAATGVYDYTSHVISMEFNSDGTIQTNPLPAFVTPSSTVNYGNWTKAALVAGLTTPTQRTGSSFTYAVRRDPTMRSWCLKGEGNCSDTSLAANSAVGNNEHHDYLLLVGGAKSTVAGTTNLTSEIYAYKPHGFSNDVGTAAPTGGDWTILDNRAAAGVRANIMAIADISTTGISDTPFTPTFVGNVLPDGSGTFGGWTGRAYHRTVYDPGMNRFYIFGGVTAATTTNVNNLTPDISSELWIYDPPALGRRPTAACFVAATPDTTTTPTSNPLGATLSLGVNRSYAAQNVVFPPGGCLQRVYLKNSRPSARLEHAMSFDRDRKMMLVFGGCNTASTVPATGGATSGSPLGNCTSSSTLLNDTWIYVPPITSEIVPSTYRTSTASSPYNNNSLFPNIFGTDFWMDHLPIFENNVISNKRVSAPTVDQAMGTWIQLAPSTSPPKRVSASLIYDRAHHKYYLQGGFGCADTFCTTTKALNDLWEFTPPNPSDCNYALSYCNSQGTWKQLKTSNEAAAAQPTIRYGAVASYAQPLFSHGDEFYTVTDSSCISQGPISSFDSSINKQYVGAIYVDVDRNQLGSNENLLINLRLLPFDQYTKLPGVSENSTSGNTTDDTDASSNGDVAIIRVQLLSSPVTFAEQIQALIQPRFHEFLSGTPIVADSFVYVSGSSGQVTERQIHIPLTLDRRINLIKIERVQGSVKFYEMTITKF